MKNSKKFLVILLTLLMVVQTSVFAEIPDLTVVIGNNAYELNYVNNKSHVKEILEQCTKENTTIYIKDDNGIWHDNISYKIVDKCVIPYVTYKNNEGKLTDYSPEDGQKNVLKVLSASFINSKIFQVKFNKPLQNISAVNKLNFRIGEKNLGEKDSIKLQKDRQTVLITLDEELKEDYIQTSIFIDKNIMDLNSNPMEEAYDKNILVLNKNKGNYKDSKKFKGDINIIADNIRITNTKIDGDCYIYGDKATIYNGDIKNNIIVDCGKNGTANLITTKAKNITVLSGGQESIHLTNVNGKELNVNSSNLTRILTQGNTKICETNVYTGSILESVDDCFGKTTISLREDTENKMVQLKGSYKQPIVVKSSATIKTFFNTRIKLLQISPKSKEDKVKLIGKFEKVKLISQFSELLLDKYTVIEELFIDSNVQINGTKTSKIMKINNTKDTKILIDENVQIEPKETTRHSSGGSSSHHKSKPDPEPEPKTEYTKTKEYKYDNGILIKAISKKETSNTKSNVSLFINTPSNQPIKEDITITIYNVNGEIVYFSQGSMNENQCKFRTNLLKGQYKATINLSNIYNEIQLDLDI